MKKRDRRLAFCEDLAAHPSYGLLKAYTPAKEDYRAVLRTSGNPLRKSCSVFRRHSAALVRDTCEHRTLSAFRYKRSGASVSSAASSKEDPLRKRRSDSAAREVKKFGRRAL